MEKLCGCTVSCGCGDNVLTSVESNVDAPECVNCEKCSESFDGDCLKYTGDTINNIAIAKGMSFNDIVQKLALLIVNPGCNYPDSPGNSVVGFYSTKINTGSIELAWNAVSGASGYLVEYREPQVVNWTANTATVTGTTDRIGGLSPNTLYYVRVTSIRNGSSCYSLTLEITTKSN